MSKMNRIGRLVRESRRILEAEQALSLPAVKKTHLMLRKVARVTDSKYLYRLMIMVGDEWKPAGLWEKEKNLSKSEFRKVYDAVMAYYNSSGNLQRIDREKADYEKDFGVLWQWYLDDVV